MKTKTISLHDLEEAAHLAIENLIENIEAESDSEKVKEDIWSNRDDIILEIWDLLADNG